MDPCADVYIHVKSVRTHVDKSRRWILVLLSLLVVCRIR